MTMFPRLNKARTTPSVQSAKPLLLVALLLWLVGCQPNSTASDVITVHKSPTCQCCNAWIDHLKRAGFSVDIRNEDYARLEKQRSDLGVPTALASCHTGVVNGYVIEGHVPAADIRKLLAEKPAARGLAVAGMPLGSPGMEQGDVVQPYPVMLFTADGAQRVYVQH